MRGLEFLQNMSEVDQELVAESERAFHKGKSSHLKKWAALVACLCLCICCTVPALAAEDNSFVYEMLYSISPMVAQKLKPINVSCTDNGIEMKVVAAEIDGENANILVSMHDTVGSRIDETADLFDSYSIHTPYDQSGGCSLVEYDADSQTATFLISIQQMKHVLIPGDKITFSVSQLLVGKRHSDARLTQIDTNNLPAITEFVSNPNIRGWGEGEGEYVDKENFQLIQPDEKNAIVLEDGVLLTGYGIADGKLHVQVRYADILTTDNHGYIYLKNQNGEKIIYEESISFWDDSNTNSYEEYIFSVSEEEISEYEIWRELWTCNDGPIKGNWQVTFPMVKKS